MLLPQSGRRACRLIKGSTLVAALAGCTETTGTNGFPPSEIGALGDRIEVAADRRPYLVLLGRGNAELRVPMQPRPRVFRADGSPAVDSDLVSRRLLSVFTKRQPYLENPLRVQADSIRVESGSVVP